MSAPYDFPEVKVIVPEVHHDPRGWFVESYSRRELERMGIACVFVQDNHSHTTSKGVVRGLHYQVPPFQQAKLVRCTAGSVFDVAVDIRRGSPSFARWFGVVLSASNRKQLFIPRGFAHGLLTLEDGSEVQYKVDDYYSSEHDRSIRFDDPDIGIEWGAQEPLLSEKDAKAPYLKKCNNLPEW